MGWYGFGATTYEEHVSHYNDARYTPTPDGDHLVWSLDRFGRIYVECMRVFDGEVMCKAIDSAVVARWCPATLVRTRYDRDPYEDATSSSLDSLAEVDDELRFIRAWLAAGNSFAGEVRT